MYAYIYNTVDLLVSHPVDQTSQVFSFKIEILSAITTGFRLAYTDTRNNVITAIVAEVSTMNT